MNLLRHRSSLLPSQRQRDRNKLAMMARRLARKHFYLVHLVYGTVVAALAFRSLLFGYGFPIPGINYTGFSPTLIGIINFPLSYQLTTGFQDSTTWIAQLPLIFPLLWSSPVVGSKLFYLWIFAVYYSLCFLVSRFFYFTFYRKSKRSYNHFSILAMVLFTFNYPFLYVLTSASLPWLLGIPVVTYLLVKWIRMARGWDQRRLDYVKVALGVGFLALADPRYYNWNLIGLFSFIISSAFVHGNFLRLTKLVTGTVLLTTPFVVLMWFAYTFGTGGLSYVSARSLSYATVANFSHAYPLALYFQLQAMSWPGFVAASPSVLALPTASIQFIPALGYPPSVLVLPGFVSGLWMVASITTMVLALGALLFRPSTDRILHSLGFIILLSLSIGAYFPLRSLVTFYVASGSLPYAGAALAITFAIPNYGLIALDSYVLFFGMASLAELLHRIPRSKSNTVGEMSRSRKRHRISSLTRRATLVCVIGLLVFSNWQLVEGSFFPGPYTPVLPGNGVAQVGDFKPVSPPALWQDAYDFFSSHDNGSYAVAWSQPYGFAYNWSPRTTPFADPGVNPSPSFYQQIASLVQSNEYYGTEPLMDCFGVRYFVIDNTSLSRLSPLPGVTLHALHSFFRRSPGLVEISTYGPDLWVYEAPQASLFRYVEAPILSPLPSTNSIFEAHVFQSVFNETPVMLPPRGQNTTGTLHQTNATLSNSSYALVPYNSIYSVPAGRFGMNLSAYYSPDDGVLPLGSSWYFDGFDGNMTIQAASGTFSVNASSGQPISAQLSFGNFVSPGHTGISIPNGSGVNISWEFAYKSSGPGGIVSTSVFANNDSWKSVGGAELFSANLPPSSTWHFVNESIEIPPGYYSFDLLFQGNGLATLNLRDVIISMFWVSDRIDGPYVVIPSYQSELIPTPNGSHVADFTPSLNTTIYSPDDGVLPLWSSWYFDGFDGNMTIQAAS